MTNDDRRSRQPSRGRESDWQGPGSGDERHGTRRSAGVHATEQGEQLRSRSADPGQSSYGGFANEDPRFQRQQHAYGRQRIKHSIEDCAEDCTGVVDVDNRITVQRDETGGYVR